MTFSTTMMSNNFCSSTLWGANGTFLGLKDSSRWYLRIDISANTDEEDCEPNNDEEGGDDVSDANAYEW